MKNTSFYQNVYEVVKKIPFGKVATYKQIAELAGNPGAARSVGTAMKNNPDMKHIPCHRVVGSDGKMHGYAFGDGNATKIALLEKEGIAIKKDKIKLNLYQWQKITSID